MKHQYEVTIIYYLIQIEEKIAKQMTFLTNFVFFIIFW